MVPASYGPERYCCVLTLSVDYMLKLNAPDFLGTVRELEFFTISPQYKNANIANFVLALSLRTNQSNVAFDHKM